ncbi:MAG TPA: HAD family phosphatase [Bryobacteraceae bacterium]|nr:HAD family phosphatase [Bryobacteraceae bacterium]
MTELKAVIFDYGNVLCHSQQPEDLEALSGAFSLSQARFDELYWLKRLPYDKSEMTPREYWDDFCHMAGIPVLDEGTFRQAMDYDNRSWSHRNPSMVAWAKEVRSQGIKTAVLSNMPLPLRVYLDANYAWLHDFDYRVFSCDVKMAKPQPEIYELCLRGLGVDAAQALFLDDRPNNIAAAQSLGIHGLLFTTAESARATLDGQFALPALAV